VLENRFLRTVVLVPIVFLPILTAGADVRDVEVAISPRFPTWQEPITATIRGESDCSVDPVARFDELGPGLAVPVEIVESCDPGSSTFRPFTATAQVGTLVAVPSKPWRLQVRSLGAVTILAEAEFRVFLAGDVEITLPQGNPTDETAFPIRIEHFRTACDRLGTPQVDGRYVVVPHVGNLCPGEPDLVAERIEPTVGPLAAGEYEVIVRGDIGDHSAVVRKTVRVYDADGCVPSDTVLCLEDARFRVEVDWQDFQGGSGEGRAVPLDGRDDTGLFWFFRESNVELTVKVLDGCGVNGHYWVFVSSGSTVGYEITVTDTSADQTRTYGNDTPALISDTAAFASCP